VYSRTGPKRLGIYRIGVDGSAPTRLTRGEDYFPRWSPDGSRIAYADDFEGSYGGPIVVMRPDGSNDRTVSQEPRGRSGGPRWSPDGREIAYTDYFYRGDGYNSAIIIAHSRGRYERRLTGYSGGNDGIAWSPDGSLIAFTRQRPGDAEIWVMRRDGSAKERLTDNHVNDLYPRWSPDGSQLAFMTEDTDPETNTRFPALAIMDIVGGDTRILTAATNSGDGSLVWSPTGEYILFIAEDSAEEGQVHHLYIIRPDGTQLTNVSADLDVDRGVWAPDGQRIAFIASLDIHVVDVAEGTPVGITNTRAYEGFLDWRPRED
jgi:TolB protein